MCKFCAHGIIGKFIDAQIDNKIYIFHFARQSMYNFLIDLRFLLNFISTHFHHISTIPHEVDKNSYEDTNVFKFQYFEIFKQKL